MTLSKYRKRCVFFFTRPGNGCFIKTMCFVFLTLPVILHDDVYFLRSQASQAIEAHSCPKCACAKRLLDSTILQMFNTLQPTLIMEEWGVKVPREQFKRLPASNDFFPSFFQRLNGCRQRAEECWGSHKLLALPTVMGCENKIILFEWHLRCYPVPRLLCLHRFKFCLARNCTFT